MPYSIIIKNGTIVDGTGTSSYVADIGIKKDIIRAIGDLSAEKADFVFDASGLFVSPGFIDLTSHSDTYGTLFYASGQESLVSQGVSTVLLGNCGESLAPIAKKESLDALERWTHIPINANWNSVGEYLSAIKKNGVGVNCATLVGHETLLRNANTFEEQIFLLEGSLDAGAWGLSSSIARYANGSTEKEIKTLLKAVKKHNGIFKVHLQDEGKNFLPSVAYAVDLSRKTGVRTIISHFKSIGRSAWPDFNKAINIIESARSERIDIFFDVFPYLRTGSRLLSLLPQWARQSGKNVLLQLNDKESAEHIVYDLKNITIHPEHILIAGAGKNKKIVGKTLQKISDDLGKSPEEAIVEILRANNLNVTIFGRTLSPKNLLTALQKEYCAVSSDGAGYDLSFKKFGDLAHPRSFGAFPRFISKLAQKSGLATEEAIKKITSIPASMLGLGDRGILRTNFKADINIFDRDNLKDNSTYYNPYQYSSGIKLSIISGNVAFFEDKFLGKFGNVLKKL